MHKGLFLYSWELLFLKGFPVFKKTSVHTVLHRGISISAHRVAAKLYDSSISHSYIKKIRTTLVGSDKRSISPAPYFSSGQTDFSEKHRIYCIENFF